MTGHDDQAEGALLAYLADADREYLLAQGIRRRFRANDYVLMEGDPSDHVHVLVSGWVRVSTIVEDGREVLFGLRGPGELLGELAAITGRPRTVSCRAIEPCTVVQLTGAQFLAVLRARPEIAIATIKTVAVRLRAAEPPGSTRPPTTSAAASRSSWCGWPKSTAARAGGRVIEAAFRRRTSPRRSARLGVPSHERCACCGSGDRRDRPPPDPHPRAARPARLRPF